ncbi:hypothetical protein [Yoonia sp.]|uniref:hypothetical protein n=1 Tax=Yoonia sp. TaxID=2212373 RepID=UPI003919100F
MRDFNDKPFIDEYSDQDIVDILKSNHELLKEAIQWMIQDGHAKTMWCLDAVNEIKKTPKMMQPSELSDRLRECFLILEWVHDNQDEGCADWLEKMEEAMYDTSEAACYYGFDPEDEENDNNPEEMHFMPSIWPFIVD